MKQLIYLAEDEENIRELLSCTLESYGYEVQAYEDGYDLLQAVKTVSPSLILLDIMMAKVDGLTALKALKSNPATADIPVIMLTAKSSEVDKVIGLDTGADDYIAKPFGLLELTARVRAAIRRNRGQLPENNAQLQSGELTLDVGSREVFLDGRGIDLTFKEFELLKMLMENARRVVNREEMLNQIWGYDYLGETRTLDMHIKTLRAKIGDDAENPRYIKTIRGVGYKFMM